MKKKIQDYIKSFSRKEQDFILSNQNMVDDILEQSLNQEEIDSLLSTAKYVNQQEKKQQITIKLPIFTLNNLRIRAKKEWLPYQTFINSILYKYVHWE